MCALGLKIRAVEGRAASREETCGEGRLRQRRPAAKGGSRAAAGEPAGRVEGRLRGGGSATCGPRRRAAPRLHHTYYLDSPHMQPAWISYQTPLST